MQAEWRERSRANCTGENVLERVVVQRQSSGADTSEGLRATVRLLHLVGATLGDPTFTVQFDQQPRRREVGQRAAPAVAVLQRLSPAERTAALLAGAFKSDAEIAAELGRSIGTVKAELHAAYKKLGVHTRAELVSLLRGREFVAWVADPGRTLQRRLRAPQEFAAGFFAPHRIAAATRFGIGDPECNGQPETAAAVPGEESENSFAALLRASVNWRPVFPAMRCRCSSSVVPPRWLLWLAVWLLLMPAAHAQLRLDLKLRRHTFLPYEAVEVILTITNFAGRDVVFENSGDGRQWLDFELTAAPSSAAVARGEEDGVPLQPVSADFRLPSLLVPAGGSVKRSFDIGPHFPLRDPGGYRLRASIWFAEGDRYFASNTAAFDLTEGKTIWQQTVGVPGGRGGDANGSGLRQLTLLTHRLPDRLLLYARVRDPGAGIVYTTQSLGRLLTSGEEPQVQLDRANHLHVLHLAVPRTYVYTVLSLDGARLTRAVYTKEGKAIPGLARGPDGRVAVRHAALQQPEVSATSSAALEGDLPVAGPADRTAPNAPRLSDRPAGIPRPVR